MIEQLAQRRALLQASHHMGALLLLDLDNFQESTTPWAMPRATSLLRQVARRLQQQIRDDDRAARLGGDRFVLILADLGTDADKARTQLESVQRAPARKPGATLRAAGQRGDDHRQPRRRAAASVLRSGGRADQAGRHGAVPGQGSRAQPPVPVRGAPGEDVTSRVLLLRDLRNALPARSWSCTTSRWSTCSASWSASRHCCAGAIRSAAWSHRWNSLPWPSRPD